VQGSRIAYLSTYPPRLCGIATFTRDLRAAVGEGDVIALHRMDDPPDFAPEVRWRIRQDRCSDYPAAARVASDSDVGLVSIQHEYGIYGGPDGSYALDFIEELRLPAVVTLHTILTHPSRGQRIVLAGLVDRAEATVVMSFAAGRLLHGRYGTPWSRIRVIRHGVPEIPLVDPDAVKPALGLEGRRVILSFGLLGPGKGYGTMVEAMGRIVAAEPTALFVVAGATHPDLVRREGEAYRWRLTADVAARGLGGSVRFVDRFLEPSELARWIQAADVYVTPYPDLDQIVSGTLSVAVAAGKAIVSTPYSYARELLAEDRGVLVEPGSPTALADAIVPLLRDSGRRDALGRRSAAFGRRMRWPQVGAAYRGLFDEILGNAVPDTAPEPRTVATAVAAVHA